MNVSVDIKGGGNVSGSGIYNSGSNVTLVAEPVEGCSFMGFYLNGERYNTPYSFIAGASDIVIEAVFYVTFENYIKGKLSFPITELALNSIRTKRGISFGADVITINTRTLELSEADAIMWYVTSSSSVSGEKDSDGGWSHQEASYSLSTSDRNTLKNMALSIYRKWGESSYLGIVKIVNLYG